MARPAPRVAPATSATCPERSPPSLLTSGVDVAMALKAPSPFHRILYSAIVAGSEIGNDHHVLGEPGWHREDARALAK